MKTKAKELKGKTEAELSEILYKKRQHLRELYFHLSGAQLKSVHEIKETKKAIAMILTLINEQKKNE
jgi:ribosomal protein L29